jgi:predicted lipid-binding transport protein (Tim44 family)
MQLDPATIIFALLALFVLWKLRSVLGERTGYEQEPQALAPQVAPPPAPAPDWSDLVDGADARAGVETILRAQPDFAPRTFLDGARSAYEMVVVAFSRGDEATLKSLASDDVFGAFAGAIAQRRAQGESMETTLVGLNSSKIVDAGVEDGHAFITVRFDAQFVMVTRDRAGAVVEGDASKPSNIIDVWTFARPQGSNEPNWTLVATSPHE